jgi:hypothetical protein
MVGPCGLEPQTPALAALLAERGLRLDAPIQWIPDFDREIYTMNTSIAGAAKLWRLSSKPSKIVLQTGMYSAQLKVLFGCISFPMRKLDRML